MTGCARGSKVVRRVEETFQALAWDLHEEDPTFSSGAWTTDEMLGYLTSAEKVFLQRAGILITDTTVVADGSTILFDRPAGTIDIQRVAFNGHHLHRQTEWDFEREDRNWRAHTSGEPSYWHEDRLAINQIEFNKMKAGTLRFFCDTLPDPYTSIHENIHLLNTWEPYLRWRVLFYCLSKDGDEQDLARAKYANDRFAFGVYLARRLMKGESALPR